MRKKEFLSELSKRLKYVSSIIKPVDSFLNLERYKVEVAQIDHTDQKEVHRDTIYFWLKDKGRPQEKVIDVRWGGSYFRIDKEIEEVITGQGIYSRNEKAERRKVGEEVLGIEEERDEDSKTWGR